MPALDLLLATADRLRLLHWTLELGAVLVPDVHYAAPHYEEIRSLSKLEQFIAARQFHVLRSDWQVEPLLMKPYVNKLKGGGFYIAQRYGGPALTYALYPQREENGRAVLGRGAIHHYSFYYSSADARRLGPGEPMKAFYAAATQLMKTGGSRLKGKVRGVWVACDGSKLLAAKQATPPQPWGEAEG